MGGPEEAGGEEKGMSPAGEDRWTALVEAELATASAKPPGEAIIQAASAYERAGFGDVAVAVLRAAGRFGADSRAVLPGLLRGHGRQRKFEELNVAVKQGLQIADRTAELRRELATALSALGQTPAAEAEWAALIRGGRMTQDDWTACARFVLSCADAPSLVQLMTAVSERQELKGNGIVGYCVIRHMVDRDAENARRVLTKVDPACIPDGEILLDLAVQSWRLGNFAKAEEAARLAAGFDDSSPVCRAVLASTRSFMGDFSLMSKTSLPVAGPVTDRVTEIGRHHKGAHPVWGVLCRESADGLRVTLLDLAEEPDMAVPEVADVVASFSIMPEGAVPDPFLVLSGVDWSWPHFMHQRRAQNSDLVHVFTEAHRHKEWLWEEVAVDPGRTVCEDGNVLRHGRSQTWMEAIQELHDIALDEE